MSKSLRSILGGGNRVRKASRPSASRQGSSNSAAASQSTSHSHSQPPSPRKQRTPSVRPRWGQDDVDAEYFPEKLEDAGGLATLLATELTLRDVVQAMRYIRAHMFSPVPETGFTSTRRTELLNYRRTMPPLVTAGHVHAILAGNGPTRVEREIAELLGRGVLRRVRVERRGGGGEALIETPQLVALLHAARAVSAATTRTYTTFLERNPTAQTLGVNVLTDAQTDELVRAGFLTTRGAVGVGHAVGRRGPERTPQRRSTAAAADCYRVAVPGHGRHLKLAEAALDWLRETLGRTKWGEGPEDWLRERFEGGGLYGPRWKEFQGAEWAWVLGEAVGLGVVEVFQTGSVGRGVRALGG
ncbi:Serine-threonine protein kinase 19 [Beauveria brongniartii RCEF 3172]|uniref:Serine-threonine protein kinase 19 n=1 Tax=Beauveria brongniartii RCEF 3172 TaxID=1081107 RepID=A0A167F1Q7_9HYPO|nr:Serine-threonine protein kinase 19 [Beauveria brongniartii RCEF 3172]